MTAATTTDYARPYLGARWIDVLPRRHACPNVPEHVLLHAGPPLRGLAAAPLLHAAIQALLFEEAAADERAAARLLGDNVFRLEPAQDHGVVTPLAQVVSASMPLLAVEQQGQVFFAPLVEGPPPALRFGSLAPACRQALHDTGTWIHAVVTSRLRRHPVAIDEIIRTATGLGDECHARTVAANAALIALLRLEPADAARLEAHPAFVLPLLMAASAAALHVHGAAVIGLGGNGTEYGVRMRGAAQWAQMPAQPPQGPRLTGCEATPALAAIGDSAVVDFCGLGGQAFAAAPLLLAEWQAVLPPDATTRRSLLIDPQTGIVDPQRIVSNDLAPLINLAILDRRGAAGLIGRGVYAAPVELFAGAGSPGGGAGDPAVHEAGAQRATTITPVR